MVQFDGSVYCSYQYLRPIQSRDLDPNQAVATLMIKKVQISICKYSSAATLMINPWTKKAYPSQICQSQPK